MKKVLPIIALIALVAACDEEAPAPEKKEDAKAEEKGTGGEKAEEKKEEAKAEEKAPAEEKKEAPAK